METNPYQSPQTSLAAWPDVRLAGLPAVDGEYLVVASGTVLPPVCVKTNQPVSEDDLVRRRFYWCTPWIAILIAASGLLLILAYFLVRRKCSLTFGLHPRVRRKYRRRILLKAVAAIALFLAIPLAAGVDSAALIMTVSVLFLVAVVALFVGNSPLSVVKYREGMFWIRGFSGEFLANVVPGEGWSTAPP